MTPILYAAIFAASVLFPILSGDAAPATHYLTAAIIVIVNLYIAKTRNLGAYTAFSALIGYYLIAFYLKISIPPISAYQEEGLQTSLALTKNLLILSILCCVIAFQNNFKRNVRASTLTLIAAVAISAVIPVPFQAVKLQYLANSFIPILVVIILLNGEKKTNSEIQTTETGSLTLIFLASIPIGYIISFHLIPTALYENWQNARGYYLIDDLPSTWSTQINSITITRFPGTGEDPIIFGYIATFLAFLMFSTRQYILFSLCVLAALLSISKGAIILLLFSMATYVGANQIKQKWLIYLIAFFGILAFYFVALGSSSSSANVHLVGLITPIESALSSHNIASLLGNGIGSSGNNLKGHLAGDLATDEWLEGGAESGLGLITYQTGLFGLGALSICLVSTFKKMQSPLSRSIWICYWINAGLQENLINLNYLSMLACTIIILEQSKALAEKNKRTI